ncbi:N-acetyl-gamma-glutamyl-phosphate reductase [compost metagenome]
MAKPLVCIEGASGTVGLSLQERLTARDDLELVCLSSRTSETERGRARAAAAVTVLCLPETAARDAVASASAEARILDASPAHRLAPGWVYGLPELDFMQPQRIRNAIRVANPGCYATGAVLLLRPLAGRLSGAVAIAAVGGRSAGGRRMIEDHAQSSFGYRLFGLDLAHRHVPEIEHYGQLPQTPVFMPAVAGHHQGTLVQIPLSLPALGMNFSQLCDLYRARYAGTGVQVVAGAQAKYLDASQLAHTDGVQLQLLCDAQEHNVLAAALFDNLGKGAAGAAEQNLELMLGLSAR